LEAVRKPPISNLPEASVTSVKIPGVIAKVSYEKDNIAGLNARQARLFLETPGVF
jgi:hypothetical protein